jgi:hypothetical protein
MFAESLDEMDDSREVVQQLVDEYHAARYSHHHLLPPVRDAGLRIRIDLMRIRIQDPGFDVLKLKKIYSWKFNFYFLDKKLQFTYP